MTHQASLPSNDKREIQCLTCYELFVPQLELEQYCQRCEDEYTTWYVSNVEMYGDGSDTTE